MRARFIFIAFLAAFTGAASAQTAPVVVNTIANMQALSGTTYPYVTTLSYSALGDNGGASFRYDGASTATTNGCTVFTASPSGRWIAAEIANPFPAERCGVQDRSGSDQSAAVQRLFNLNMPVVFRQNGVTRIDQGLTFDANYVRVDCAGGNLDFSNLASGNTAFTITTDTIQPEYLRAHNFDHCAVLGPASSLADTTGFEFTPKISGLPQFNAFTFSNGGASGFRNLNKLGNGTQFISWENYTYNNQTANCGAFIRLVGTTNAGEMYKGVNLAVLGCTDIIVDAIGAPDAEFTCDGCSFDQMDRVLTGDNGGGPGSNAALAGISHFCCHWENPNSIVGDHMVWAGGAYGAGFSMDSGGYMRLPDTLQGLGRAPFRIDGPVNGRGLILRDVLVAPIYQPGTFLVEGGGNVSASHIRTYGVAVPFFAVSANLIPDFNFTTGSAVLPAWSASSPGTVTVDSTVAPTGASGSLKIDGTGGSQFAKAFATCSPGRQYGAQALWQTGSGASVEETIQAIGAGGIVLDQNTTPTGSSVGAFARSPLNASRSAPPGTVQIAVIYRAIGGVAWIGRPQLVCQ